MKTGHPKFVMRRLTVLMIEVEQPEGLSSRKLMVESAKQNVLTAYSGEEGIEVFRKNLIHVVVVHSKVQNPPAREVVETIRREDSEVPIVVISPRHEDFGRATMVISSYDPEKLMDVVKTYRSELLGEAG